MSDRRMKHNRRIRAAVPDIARLFDRLRREGRIRPGVSLARFVFKFRKLVIR
jgi:hypothetical protein